MADPFATDDTLAGDLTTTTDAGADAPKVIGGRYQILGLVGSGGMGSVYRARDVELDETVALKLLRRELVDAPAMLARFRQEVKLARRVTHTNVARVFDIGEDGAVKFLTMEYVEGEPLSTLIARRGALPLEEVRAISSALSAGLAAAHSAGVVHRDLKPDNILVGNRVVITDFGIARAFLEGEGTNTQGAILGTPAYMAPEQVEGREDIDERADVYALGAVLFELVTGERAWRGESVLAVAAARLTQPPPDPRSRRAVPDPIADVILRCLTRSRGERLPRAVDVGTALEQAFAQVSRWTPPPQAPQKGLPSSHDKSVAVLPFRNAGPPEDEYIAEGLTEDLVDTLSMTRGLRVRPQSLVSRHREEKDSLAVGRSLEVQVIVEGSVRKSGERTRVNARAIHVADGFQIWAHRFDAAPGDLLMVSDRMAHSIAAALTAELAAPAREGPSDPAAIELYLRARKQLRNTWNGDPLPAINLFEKALALAPDDANIVAAMALALARGAFIWGGEKALNDAHLAAERAVARAPNLGESWVALTNVRMYLGDAVGAADALRAGLRHAPTSGRLHELFGQLSAEVGLLDDAKRHFDSALKLDPTLTQVQWDLARLWALLGEWERADALLETRVEDDAAYLGRTVVRARLAMWRSRTIEVPPDLAQRTDAHGLMIQLLAHAQRSQAGGRINRDTLQLVKSIAEPQRRRLASFLWQLHAELSGSLGDVDGVLASVAHGLDTGLCDVAWLTECPALAESRRDPRFAALAARVEAHAAPIRAALSR